MKASWFIQLRVTIRQLIHPLRGLAESAKAERLRLSDRHATIVNPSTDQDVICGVLADNIQGDPMSSTSDELSLAQVRSLTALVYEVRVAAESLPDDEREALIASRKSISDSQWSAETRASRPLQRRAS
jgi:hypothetical protein